MEAAMLQNHSILRALLAKYCGPAALAMAASLLVGNATWADDGNGKGGEGNEAGRSSPFRPIDTAPPPTDAQG
jgi:hypothetical protein